MQRSLGLLPAAAMMACALVTVGCGSKDATQRAETAAARAEDAARRAESAATRVEAAAQRAEAAAETALGRSGSSFRK